MRPALCRYYYDTHIRYTRVEGICISYGPLHCPVFSVEIFFLSWKFAEFSSKLTYDRTIILLWYIDEKSVFFIYLQKIEVPIRIKCNTRSMRNIIRLEDYVIILCFGQYNKTLRYRLERSEIINIIIRRELR